LPAPRPDPAEIEQRYGLTVRSLTSLGGDRAWRLISDRGDHVLRVHGPQRAAAHEGEIAVLRRLQEADYPAPRLLADTDGQLVLPMGTHSGYLVTYLEGQPTPPGPETAQRLGRSVGRLHRIDVTGVPTSTFTVESARVFFDSLDADPLTWDWEGYPALRDDLLQAWSDLGDLNDLPAAMIHTDVCFENTIQTATGEVVLIDWDDAGLAPALQDVGYFLVHEAIPSGDAVDWDRARAFLDGYQSERPLETREWDRLADALVFGALAYVLAPWESKIYHLNWQRLRCVRELGPRLVEGLRR
jgi:Ser/Thr protein kinase RdoA (MazF antagonist)